MDVSDITFDKINTGMQDIVDFFKNLLDTGDYDKANSALRAVQSILDVPPEAIELSDGENIDPNDPNSPMKAANNFEILYEKFRQLVADRETAGPVAAMGTDSFDDVKNVMTEVTTRIFRTSEARQALVEKDPDQSEFLKALQGEKESQLTEKKDNQNIVRRYEAIEQELFFDKGTTPAEDRRIRIENHDQNIQSLQFIKQSLDEIKTRITNIKANPTSPDVTTWQNEITSLKNDINTEIATLTSRGITGIPSDLLDETKIETDVSQNDLQTAVIDPEQARLEAELEAIRLQLEAARNGAITISYQDVDGNTITANIDNEEVILNMDPATIATPLNADKVRQAIQDVTMVKTEALDRIAINDDLITSYDRNISIIEKENEILARDTSDRARYLSEIESDASVKAEMDAEKQRRHDDARAKFMGDSAAKKKYNQAYDRFSAARIRKTEDVTIDGVTITIEYDGLKEGADYPNKKDDLEFMQLESWEERSRRIALIEAFGEKTYSDTEAAALAAGDTAEIAAQKAMQARQRKEVEVYLMDNPILGREYQVGMEEYLKLLDELHALQAAGAPQVDIDNKKAEIEAKIGQIQPIIQAVNIGRDRDADYVKNYNSSHFVFKDAAAILVTGGSAMAIKNNQANPTIADRIQAVTKFTNPFTIKSDGKRHVITSTLATAGGVLSLPVRALETLYGATASLAVKVVKGKDFDRPTPYNVGSFARAEAREEYLRNHGSTAFGAWLKSRLPWRAKNLNEKIIEERCAEIDASIDDKHINGAIAQDIVKQEEAVRNQRTRLALYKEMVRKNPELYIDLYDNVGDKGVSELYMDNGSGNMVLRPEVVDSIAKRVMARSLAKADGVTDQSQTFAAFERDANGKVTRQAKTRPSKGKFKQSHADTVTDRVSDIDTSTDYRKTLGDTLWTNAASRQNIRRGMTKLTDLALRVATAATLPAIKSYFNQIVIKAKTHTEIGTEQYYTYTKKPVYRDDIITTKGHDITTTGQIPPDQLTLGDIRKAIYEQGGEAKFSAHGGGVSGTFQPGGDELQALDVYYTDAQGVVHEHSVGVQTLKNWIERDRARGIARAEATERYIDPSNFSDSTKLLDLIQKEMPGGQDYVQWLMSQPNPTEALTQSLQGSLGFDLGEFEMSTGWGGPKLDKLVGTITQHVPGTTQHIKAFDHFEMVPVPHLRQVTREVVDKAGVTLGQLMAKVGKVGLLSDIFHTYKKGRKNTERSSDGKTEQYKKRNAYDHYQHLKQDDFDGPDL